jgi:hypothetical protein
MLPLPPKRDTDVCMSCMINLASAHIHTQRHTETRTSDCLLPLVMIHTYIYIHSKAHSSTDEHLFLATFRAALG